MDDDQLKDYFSGSKIYGDDFSAQEIAQWFADEEEGYANLGAKNKSAYQYEYHALNQAHGFRYLKPLSNPHILSIGGAYGEELTPVLPSAEKITILDPSSAFAGHVLGGIPVDYVKPHANGIMPFDSNTFDLVTCFGCLHHIPNVSTVLKEIFRCLKLGGVALIREPIVSMGDWRKSRVGLTRRERGIPLIPFRRALLAAGFSIYKDIFCGFPLTPRLRMFLRKSPYNSSEAVLFDQLLSKLFSWNYTYHPTTLLAKLTPTAVAFVVEKPPIASK